MTFQIALQRVQLEGRQIHVLWTSRHFEQTQNVPDFLHMRGLDAPRCAGVVKSLKPFVPESDYHDYLYRVSLHDARSKRLGPKT